MIFKYFLQSHTLEELSVFTQYLVSLRVFNPEGAGPDTIVVVMTDEGGENHRNMWSDQIIQTLLFFLLLPEKESTGFIHSLGGDTFNDISFLFDQAIAWQTNQRSYDNT